MEGPGALYNNVNIMIYNGNWKADTVAEPQNWISVEESKYLYKRNCLERKFTGTFTQKFQDIELEITISISGFLGRDYSYHGRENPTIAIVDKKYSAEIKIEGNYSPDTNTLHFNEISFYWSKPLPYGLRWELGEGNFKLFKNSNITDGFVLDGEIGGTKMILYSNDYTP